jgi:hypothetical protein
MTPKRAITFLVGLVAIVVGIIISSVYLPKLFVGIGCFAILIYMAIMLLSTTNSKEVKKSCIGFIICMLLFSVYVTLQYYKITLDIIPAVLLCAGIVGSLFYSAEMGSKEVNRKPQKADDDLEDEDFDDFDYSDDEDNYDAEDEDTNDN